MKEAMESEAKWDNHGKSTGNKILVKYHLRADGETDVLTFLHRGKYGEARVTKKLQARYDTDHQVEIITSQRASAVSGYPEAEFVIQMREGLRELHSLLNTQEMIPENWTQNFHEGSVYSFSYKRT
ncbi:MAG: hypothetical protein ACI9BS_001824 [Candidatus Poriferisodalaceae bacterium]|jgi:hypothetical protein|tara:strand:- start:918 stop:1295 length:378 start_codon:yes stop_codon:yes gene_type:complete